MNTYYTFNSQEDIRQTRIIDSNTTHIYKKGAYLIPASNDFTMVATEGARPKTFYALSADADEGAITISTTNEIIGAEVGKFLGIESDDPISGTNLRQTKCFIIAGIKSITGTGPYTYTLDRPLSHNVTTENSAQAGVMTMKTDIHIENLQLNVPEFTQDMKIGLQLNQCARGNIYAPRIFGSKPARGLPSAGFAGRSAITLTDCVDISIYDPFFDGIGWYGIAMTRSCRNIKIFGGTGYDCRHLIDTTWETATGQRAGEPTDIYINDMINYNSAFSGFSTHENGKNIYINNCTSYNAGFEGASSGLFLRNHGTIVRNFKSFYSTGRGIDCNNESKDTILINPLAQGNVLDGIHCQGLTKLENAISISNEESGIRGIFSEINGATIENNDAYALRFDHNDDRVFTIVRDITAPQNARQGVAMRFEANMNPRNTVKFEGQNYMPGYGNSLFEIVGNNNRTNIPQTSGTIVTALGTDDNPTKGTVTLSSGTATVETTAVRRYTGVNFSTNSSGDQISNIRLNTIAFGSNPGDVYISNIVDQTSFTISCSDATSNQQVQWEITGV